MTALESTDPEGDFERIFNEFKEMAWRVAYGILRDRQRAEDAVQEALGKEAMPAFLDCSLAFAASR